MTELNGSQRKYLRGLAHNLNPAAAVGRKGITDALLEEIEESLEASELIKVKFLDFKDKQSKKELVDEIAKRTDTFVAGMVGHVAILYRQHPGPDKRKIRLQA